MNKKKLTALLLSCLICGQSLVLANPMNSDSKNKVFIDNLKSIEQVDSLLGLEQDIVIHTTDENPQEIYSNLEITLYYADKYANAKQRGGVTNETEYSPNFNNTSYLQKKAYEVYKGLSGMEYYEEVRVPSVSEFK